MCMHCFGHHPPPPTQPRRHFQAHYWIHRCLEYNIYV
jgi:hypothetical protein